METERFCPGCGRRCSAQAPRCAYGQAYFARQQVQPVETKPEKQHKWERDVQHGGVMWQLLGTGHRVKKTLHKGKATEAQLLSGLTDTEKRTLTDILSKIDPERRGA